MDTALLAYSGISVRMLVDRGFGADLVTMFTVDYEAGGAAQAHDHPFEEAYVFLAGEIEAELDGEHHVLRAGDVVFAGVGACTASGTPAPNACAGSRPRHPSRRAGTPIAGSMRGAGSREAEEEDCMSSDGSVVVVGGTRAIGLGDRRGTTSTPGATVVLTGRDPANVAAAVAEARRPRDRA